MDELASRAVIVGVAIFVTLLILTVIIFEYQEIKELYKFVGETDISFEEKLDEFDKYRDSNNEFTGLDVRNALKKYKNNNEVIVCIGTICDDVTDIDTIINGMIGNDYTEKYYSEMDESNGYKIIFSRK